MVLRLVCCGWLRCKSWWNIYWCVRRIIVMTQKSPACLYQGTNMLGFSGLPMSSIILTIGSILDKEMWEDGSADHLARAGTSFSACCSRPNDINPDPRSTRYIDHSIISQSVHTVLKTEIWMTRFSVLCSHRTTQSAIPYIITCQRHSNHIFPSSLLCSHRNREWPDAKLCSHRNFAVVVII